MVQRPGYFVYRFKNPMFLMILSALLLVSCLGCGRAYYLHPDIDAAKSADLTQGKGSILFECNGPESSAKIVGHLITIDKEEPIFVENFSRQQVIVATGRHLVQIVTIASDHRGSRHLGQRPPADKHYEYGKKVEASFWMIDSGAVIARYTPPSTDNESGRLWIL